MKLSSLFYQNNVVDVARNLIGKRLVYGPHQGIIIETEAYRGEDDPASHAYRGMTKRSSIMFGPPGYAYVYMIYGMHYCFNIVAEEEDQAGAVLIRGLMLPHMDIKGPGKVCRYLGITKKDNGANLMNNDFFYVTEGVHVKKTLVTPRIGITRATDKPWRFVANKSR